MRRAVRATLGLLAAAAIWGLFFIGIPMIGTLVFDSEEHAAATLVIRANLETLPGERIDATTEICLGHATAYVLAFQAWPGELLGGAHLRPVGSGVDTRTISTVDDGVSRAWTWRAFAPMPNCYILNVTGGRAKVFELRSVEVAWP